MKSTLLMWSVATIFINPFSVVTAQDDDEAAGQPTASPDNTLVLETITVKGQALKQRSSFSATDLSVEDIRIKRVSEVNELLEDVPGVNVRDYGLGGVASSTVIRGFGDGAHGGDMGVVIDGIPLNEANSHADGYVDLNVIVPLEVKNLTVYRGPVSALYGNFNRGGLVALETRNTGNYAEADLSAGSFDTFDAQAAFGITPSDTQQYNVAAQVFQTDGFRPQSDTDRATLAGRANFNVTPKFDLSVSARYHEAEADSAAYTTLDQFETDPYGIDPRVQNDGTDKTFGTLRVDLGYQINDDITWLNYAYATQQDFTRWFSRGAADAPAWRQREETYDRKIGGVGTSLNGQSTLAGKSVAYALGVEAFEESTEFQLYDDLDNRQRVLAEEFNRDSTLTSVAVFTEVDIALTSMLDLSFGLRADEFDGDCKLLGVETGTAPCERLDAMSNVSPKIGLRAQVLDPLQLRISYSEGFALADGFAKFATSAQSLEVNDLRQVEVGALLELIDAVRVDVAFYQITSTNEISEVTPGEFVNFGETARTGFESSLAWHPSERFELKAVYGYADSEIEENLDPTLIGNRVTGVPDHSATLTASLLPVSNLRLSATARYIGEYAIDAANTSQSDSYSVVDLDASYQLDTRIPTQVFVKINNATDKVYASTINSLGASPGAPRAVYAGVQLGF